MLDKKTTKKMKHYNEKGTYVLITREGKILERFRTKYTAELRKVKLEKIYGELEIKQLKDSIKGRRKYVE